MPSRNIPTRHRAASRVPVPLRRRAIATSVGSGHPLAGLHATLLVILLAVAPAVSAERAVSGQEPLCYHVSSYHAGFPWTDGIERGLREGLEGHCRVETFHLDTKRFLEPSQIRAAAQKAHRRMLEIEPDIVIASDDNAVRHFVEPRLLGTDMPVVFCGVNWTIEEYRLPDPNVTGMIEVWPLDALLKLGREMTLGGEHVAYLTADTLSARKDSERMRERVRALGGFRLDPVHVDSAASWRDAYRRLQGHSFILLGDIGALEGWDEGEMREFVRENARIPVLSANLYLMPYAVVGLTRIPEEQGEWAAASAVAILNGMSPSDIPLMTNRRWDRWINEPLLAHLGLTLKRSFLRGAKRVR